MDKILLPIAAFLIGIINVEVAFAGERNACEDEFNFAMFTMSTRQQDAPLSEMMRFIELTTYSDPTEIAANRSVVMDAYAFPKVEDQSGRFELVDNFAREYALKCYRGQAGFKTKGVSLWRLRHLDK